MPRAATGSSFPVDFVIVPISIMLRAWTDEGDRNLLEKHIPALLEARPDFCSVTYGAGGSTRDKTLEDRGSHPARSTA